MIPDAVETGTNALAAIEVRPRSPRPKSVLCRAHLLSLAALATFVVCAHGQTPSVTTQAQPGRLSGNTVLLPNGWKISPAGQQVPVGGLPLRVVAVPHTNLALITSNGYGDQYLSLIDLVSHSIIQRVPMVASWMGLAVTSDGKTVYASTGSADSIAVFHLNAGRLTPDGTIPLPQGTFPAGIVLNSENSRLFVAGNLANNLLAVDTASRKVLFQSATGRKPYACALVPKWHAVYVSNWGEDSLSTLSADNGQLIARVQVHERPGDIIASPDGNLIFVTNGDRNIVSIIDTATQRTIEEIDTSISQTPLPGSMPDGLALSADGNTLFVANANNNSVTVVDVAAPLHSTVLGFLPTGWFPTSVAAAGEGKAQRLLVANGKGDQSYENGSKWPAGTVANDPNPGFVGRVLQGTVSVIPFTALVQLPRYTREVRSNSPFLTPPASTPAPFALGRSGPIQHVIYIIKENRTYDQILGDMPEGNGEASYAIFGKETTPNQHAIARQFTLIDNLYHNAEISATGHFWTDSAIASEYVEKLWPSTNSKRGGKRMDFHDDDDDYPSSGFIWDECAKKGLTYRSYGEFGRIRGAQPGKVRPAMSSLADHVSPTYLGADAIASFSDLDRYAIWKREFDAYAKDDSLPAFEVLSLPGDHTVGTRPGSQTPRAMIAENDLVVGKMVDDISHSPYWKNTAIFILEDDAQNGPDHIDCHRTRPLPQMPLASTCPITVACIFPSESDTREMAPVAARIPIRIELASKAGPAAVEAQRIPWLLPIAISPLVPRSTNAISLSATGIPTAIIPARMSDPTKPPRHRRKRIRQVGDNGQCRL